MNQLTADGNKHEHHENAYCYQNLNHHMSSVLGAYFASVLRSVNGSQSLRTLTLSRWIEEGAQQGIDSKVKAE
jgi:hypothetical protein